MKLFRLTIILFAGLISACLLACQEKSSALSQPGNAVVRVKEAKPGAAIKLISSPIVFISANEPTQVDLLLNAKESTGALNLELSATDGLEVLDTQMHQKITLTPSITIKVPVKLRAITDGRYYLNIHTSIDNGSSPSRTLALIVQVGAEGKAIQLKKPSGENVITLPAQETISNQ